MIAVLVSTVQIISSLLAAGRSSTPSQDASQANETLWPTVGFVCVGIFFLLCQCSVAVPFCVFLTMTAARHHIYSPETLAALSHVFYHVASSVSWSSCGNG
jgi:hypothetical protein